MTLGIPAEGTGTTCDIAAADLVHDLESANACERTSRECVLVSSKRASRGTDSALRNDSIHNTAEPDGEPAEG